MHDEGANKSEVARLRQQIDLEFEAMQRGLTGLALGTARHSFINARIERVHGYQCELAQLVGESKATQIVCEHYNAAMEGNESAQITDVPVVEIVPTKTLWLLECTEGDGYWYKMVPFYAVSEQDAEAQVQKWIEQQPYEIVRTGLRPYPQGFRIRREMLPGKI